jgi:hypothetical protein
MGDVKIEAQHPLRLPMDYKPRYPLAPKHRCGSGALAAICGRIRVGGGAPCTSIPMDNRDKIFLFVPIPQIHELY